MLEWSRLYRLEFRLPGHGGGILGYVVGPLSVKWMGFTGSAWCAIAGGVIGSALVFRFSWSHVAERIGARVYSLVESRREKREIAEDMALGQTGRGSAKRRSRRSATASRCSSTTRAESRGPAPGAGAGADRAGCWPRCPRATASPRSARSRCSANCPTASCRRSTCSTRAQLRQETVSPDTLEMTSRMIEKKLKDFGVEVRVVLASPGPVITRYEIEPATGVKGSQIVGLAKDLARSLSLVSIRVVETIPGKNYMALELPNAKRQSIKLSEILGSQVYNEGKSLLTMGLGKDIIGNPVVADLAKMPHVLVAGTTGSGKSVGINAMILSLLYKAEARDVRLLMIDPKMLEMSVYEGIPHLLAPVVTDMRQAAHGLNWCVAEMERRYKLMSKLGVRNLAGYNTKIDEAKAREEFIYNPFSLTPDDPEPLRPRAAHRGGHRRAGRPDDGGGQEDRRAHRSPGAEGARRRHPPDPGHAAAERRRDHRPDQGQHPDPHRLPGRSARSTAAPSSTRWAPKPAGHGRHALHASGSGLPMRVHGAFVSDEEVHRVVAYLKSQGEPDYIEGVLEGGTVDGDGDLLGDGGGEAAARKTRCTTRRSKSCSRTARPAFRWCSAT
jgi:S-DNA-T family DNA segregation ATPase FtsK/SpoIIIE